MSAGPALLCLGEAMVEFVREAGGRTFRQGFGGDTSNAAIAAARQGCPTGYVTALGQDRFGDDLIAFWQSEGVDTALIRRDAQAPTGIYFVDPDPAGQHFTYYRSGSAASRMRPADLDRAALGQTRHLHFSGITLAVSAGLRETALAAASTVRAAGGRVSLDTNLRLKLWPQDLARQEIERAMPLADLAFTSIDDSKALTGKSDPAEIAAHYQDLGPGIVAVTMGGAGCYLATPGQALQIPAAPADPIDSTGAGDSFAGAMLAWLLETGDPVKAAHAAAIVAAGTVSALGATDAIPHRAHVLARLGTG